MKKLYWTVTFSGLAEAVSAKGGEEAFASGVNFQLTQAVRRAGAFLETTFVRGDGTGRLTNVNGTQAAATTVNVDDARPFLPMIGKVLVFLNNTTGLKTAGPVTLNAASISGGTITVSSAVSVTDDDGIYVSGEQSESAAPAEITALGLPAIVNNTGTIYNLSRTTHPSLQSKVLSASSTSLDESLLRRLRRRLLVETDMGGSYAGYVMISNYEQYDRYTEIALPFRRMNDQRLELGASQELTTFEGHPWVISHVADPARVYLIGMESIVRGVVRPFAIDPRVNMSWIPGQDAFTVLFKTYCENVARHPNQTAVITTLTVPTY